MMARWEREIRPLRRIAFDSNALIYLLENREPYTAYVEKAVNRLDDRQATGIVSAVVEMEMLGRPLRLDDEEAYERVEQFINNRPNLIVRAVDRSVARTAAEVRQKTRLAPLDAIIVATALEERCDAIVGNDSVIARRSPAVGMPYLYLDVYTVM